QDQVALRWPGDRGVTFPPVSNLNGAWLALRFRQVVPVPQRLPGIAVAAHPSRRVPAKELAARRHAMDAPTSPREIRHLVRFREGGLVDLAEEVPLGVFPMRLDLKVERDGNEVLFDHVEIRVAEEPGPGPDTGASGPSQRVAIAHPDQDCLALLRRLLP